MPRKDEKPRSFAQRAIREQRLQAGLTQEELDDAAGLPRGTVGNLENSREPSEKYLIKLARALNLDRVVFAESAVVFAGMGDRTLWTTCIFYGVVPRRGWDPSQREQMKKIPVAGDFDPETTCIVRIAGTDYAPRFLKGQMIVCEMDDTPRSGVPLLIESGDRLDLGKVFEGKITTLLGEGGNWSVLGYAVAVREDDPGGIPL